MPAAAPMITFTPVGWDELASRYDGSREKILRGMNNAFIRIGRHMIIELKNYTPVGTTKNLRNKTTAEKYGTAKDLRVELRQSAFSEKGYPYGAGVRMSTRPHWVPYKVLIPWVELKWGGTDREVKRGAYFLAKKIERVGTQANPYHIRALEANKGILVDMMKEEVEKVIEELG